jgi:hypothetical protein
MTSGLRSIKQTHKIFKIKHNGLQIGLVFRRVEKF